MQTVRDGIFETSSSSVHAISISKGSEFVKFPKCVVFKPNYFYDGGEFLVSVSEKASYLFSAMVMMYHYEEDWDDVDPSYKDTYDNYKEFIRNTLKKHGIASKFVETEWDCFYIGHGDMKWINDVCTNETLLMNYLFNPKSYVALCTDSVEDLSESLKVPEFYDIKGYKLDAIDRTVFIKDN